jgi:hypothetical protein
VWRIHYWGTKWDLECADKEGAALGCYTHDPGVMSIAFDTAWSPPEAVIGYAAKQFPKLRFELEFGEPGMCFAGKTVWANGAMEESTDYPEGSEGYERMCGSEPAYDDGPEEAPATPQ